MASSQQTTESVARALGWFSLALGAAELFATSPLAQLVGLRDSDSTRKTLRAFGAREMAAGVALLAQPDRAQWLWSRVGGDALDLAWMAARLGDEETDRTRLGAALVAVAGVTALDVVAAQRTRREQRGTHRGRARLEQVVTINRSADELYRFWRDLTHLPRFMRHLERVEVLDPRRSRWTARGPAGVRLQWDAEIVQDLEGEWLAWRSMPGSQVEHSGSVRFTPAAGARGTEVRVQLEYAAPGGAVGRGVAMLVGESPESHVREDLRRFKQLMETGEIPLSDGPGLWRAAQPMARTADLRAHEGVHA